MSYASKKGYEAEHAVEEVLRELAPQCYRPRAGARNDVGDVIGLPLVISVKNHRALDLAGWISDVEEMAVSANKPGGVVWHKRAGRGHPEAWYVTMTGKTFMTLMRVYVRLSE